MKTLNNKINLNALVTGSKSFKANFEHLYQEFYDYLKAFKSKEDEVILTIVLPMLNEEKTIKAILESLPYDGSIEIIVVNDFSTDNSLKEVDKVKLNRKIKVINHKKNQGYGRAIISGILQAKGKVIVTMDSDGQHSPDDIFNLVKPIFEGEADYTIGSRYKGTYFYKLPLFTRLGEVIVEKFIQLFFGPRVVNNQTGFRAFNRKVVPILNSTKYPGYAYCTEQILRVSLSGFKIKECPIKVYNRQFGSSKIVLRILAGRIFSCLIYYYIQKIKFMIKRTRKINSL